MGVETGGKTEEKKGGQGQEKTRKKKITIFCKCFEQEKLVSGLQLFYRFIRVEYTDENNTENNTIK